jgi:hypothetical protein
VSNMFTIFQMDANLQLLLAPTPNWRLATIILSTS